MTHMMCTAKANSISSFTSGLFVASVFIGAISFSKRFSSELLNFLCGIVFLSTPEDKTKPTKYVLQKHVPPFRPIGKESTLFCDKFTKGNISPNQLKLVDMISVESTEVIDEEFSISCLYSALGMLNHLADIWKEVTSSKIIFVRLKSQLLPRLPTEKLHQSVNERVTSLSDKLDLIMKDTETMRKLSL